jgi:signal transduction histidine kinase
VQAESLNDVLARFRERAARGWRRGHPSGVDFTRMPELRLAPERAVQVLRILQELLTNTLKHAQAQVVQVDLELLLPPAGQGTRHLLLMCADGLGFDASAALGGCGLASLRQRARALGGTLQIETRPGAGVHTD